MHDQDLEIDSFVYGRFRLLANFQKYTLDWPESTEAKFCVAPDVWTYLAEDGKLQEEQRRVWHARFVTIDEDGVVRLS